MYILGLNAYHWDSSACIYKDDELLACTEEERINRIKHWSGLPVNAVRFCLEDANISLEDIDYITIGHNPKSNLSKKIFHSITNLVSLEAIKRAGQRTRAKMSIKTELAEAFGIPENKLKATVKFVEHHRSHLASAFHISPYRESALLSIDAFGDFTSTMLGIGTENQIKVLDQITYPHSLGMFYTAFTQYLGFPYVGDEYKVMGLSPYGKPTFMKDLEDVLVLKDNGLFELNGKYFSYFRKGVVMEMRNNFPYLGEIYSSALADKFGPQRKKGDPLTQYHKDLAASVQAYTEKAIFHIAEGLYQRTKIKNLCLAGGVAQNSAANGKLLQNTSFERLFVPPASHDAGTATGSALYFYHHVLGNPRPGFKVQPYTGFKSSNEEIEAYLKTRKIAYKKYRDETLYDLVSDKLINGGVIGWYQGRAEFGPRALGNRSILVDPRRTDAKALLNEKIKKRESFRPFAPSILKEHLPEYFEQIDDVPYMEKVYDIKPDKHAIIPAVTHVNGTGRLQTVEKTVNPRYYTLIEKFYEKTSVPVLLNTSFNENEPIVNTPEHALECFLRTKMDMLVLGNIVISRNGQ